MEGYEDDKNDSVRRCYKIPMRYLCIRLTNALIRLCDYRRTQTFAPAMGCFFHVLGLT